MDATKDKEKKPVFAFEDDEDLEDSSKYENDNGSDDQSDLSDLPGDVDDNGDTFISQVQWPQNCRLLVSLDGSRIKRLKNCWLWQTCTLGNIVPSIDSSFSLCSQVLERFYPSVKLGQIGFMKIRWKMGQIGFMRIRWKTTANKKKSEDEDGMEETDETS